MPFGSVFLIRLSGQTLNVGFRQIGPSLDPKADRRESRLRIGSLVKSLLLLLREPRHIFFRPNSLLWCTAHRAVQTTKGWCAFSPFQGLTAESSQARSFIVFDPNLSGTPALPKIPMKDTATNKESCYNKKKQFS
jgi:hypothetical protein